MKRKLIATIGILASIVVLSLGIYHSDAAKEDTYLTTKEVKNLVSAQYPGDVTEMELVEGSNEALYRLTIEEDDKQYHLKLDASSGEILELKENVQVSDKKQEANDKKKERLTAEEKNKNASKKDESTEKGSKQKDDEEKPIEEQELKQEDKDKKALIPVGEASEIALKEFSGEITEVELEEDDGRLIYEIEIESGEQEAEIEIDAYTGEILVLEIDD